MDLFFRDGVHSEIMFILGVDICLMSVNASNRNTVWGESVHLDEVHIDGLVQDCNNSYCCTFYGCQTWDSHGKHVNQLNVEWNKALQRTLNLPYKTHRRLLNLTVNGKSFKSQHCSRPLKYVNGFFSGNIYVSFISAKAKTRVTGSLGRNWARLAGMDGLV